MTAVESSSDHADDIRRDLQRVGEQHTAAGRTAAEASEQSSTLRRRATDLSTISAPLAGLLDRIRSLHVVQNWEGRAATASRRRLDAHEERCAAALIAVDTLVADLESGARAQASIAASARSEQRRLAPVLDDLRDELRVHERYN